MGALGAAIAISQYAAILTAVGALARLSLLLVLRGVDLWQDTGAKPEQTLEA
jgi:hypothetical protein